MNKVVLYERSEKLLMKDNRIKNKKAIFNNRFFSVIYFFKVLSFDNPIHSFFYAPAVILPGPFSYCLLFAALQADRIGYSFQNPRVLSP